MATALTTVTNPGTAGAVMLGCGICWRVTSRILGVDLRHDEPWCRATLYRLDLEQPFYIALTVKASRGWRKEYFPVILGQCEGGWWKESLQIHTEIYDFYSEILLTGKLTNLENFKVSRPSSGFPMSGSLGIGSVLVVKLRLSRACELKSGVLLMPFLCPSANWPSAAGDSSYLVLD